MINATATAPKHGPVERGARTRGRLRGRAQRGCAEGLRGVCGRGLTPVRAAGSYTGEWREDKQHGHAIFTFADGRRCVRQEGRHGVSRGVAIPGWFVKRSHRAVGCACQR